MTTLFLIRLSHVESRDYPLEDGTNQWGREETEENIRWTLVTEAEKAVMEEEIVPDDPESFTRMGPVIKIEDEALDERELLGELRGAVEGRAWRFFEKKVVREEAGP